MNYFNLDKSLELFHSKKIEKVYFLIDIHGTILKPRVDKNEISHEYYKEAKETLQFLTKLSECYLILSTCSYPDQVKSYLDFFESDGIIFDAVNENKEVDTNFGGYPLKIYANVILDDKGGFEEQDWKQLKYILNRYYPKTFEIKSDLDEALEKLKNIDPKDIEEYFDRIKNKEEIKKSQLKRLKDKIENKEIDFEELILKLENKYQSKQYKDRWYSRGIMPQEKLLYFLFDYAEEYGIEIDDPRFDTGFSNSKYLIHGYVLRLTYGQGTVVDAIKF